MASSFDKNVIKGNTYTRSKYFTHVATFVGGFLVGGAGLADDAAKFGDDVAKLGDDFTKVADDIEAIGDDAARAIEEGSQALSTPSSKVLLQNLIDGASSMAIIIGFRFSL